MRNYPILAYHARMIVVTIYDSHLIVWPLVSWVWVVHCVEVMVCREVIYAWRVNDC